MSDIPVWNCEFFPLKSEGAPAMDALTVGAKFGLKCHGDIAIPWDQGAPQVVFPKEDQQYSLAILKVVRQDPNDTQYEVTAYRAGELKPEYMRVVQGKGSSAEKGFEVTQPKWSVKSVLDPKSPPQPYGPLGPWTLSLPLWIWLAAFLTVVLFVYFTVRKLRRMSQRRRMLENLKLHKTALPPLYQFYRDARQLRRRLHTLKNEAELKQISEDLEKEFRLFVLRQFQVPAMEWSNRAILEDLRRRHRKTYARGADALRKTLRELEKLKARQNIGVNDLEQMYRMSLDTAEKLGPEGGHT